MARRNQFECDAESVQEIAGATVTFRSLKVRVFREYRADPTQTDETLLTSQILTWSGIVDADGHALPNPKDEPEAIGELYMHEKDALVKLLMLGPDGVSAKN